MGVLDSIKNSLFSSDEKKKKTNEAITQSDSRTQKAALNTSQASNPNTALKGTGTVGKGVKDTAKAMRDALVAGPTFEPDNPEEMLDLAMKQAQAKINSGTVEPIGPAKDNKQSIRDRLSQIMDDTKTGVTEGTIDLAKVNTKDADSTFMQTVQAYNSEKQKEARQAQPSIRSTMEETIRAREAMDNRPDMGEAPTFGIGTVAEDIQNKADNITEPTAENAADALATRDLAGFNDRIGTAPQGNQQAGLGDVGGTWFGGKPSSTFDAGSGNVNPTLNGEADTFGGALRTLATAGVVNTGVGKRIADSIGAFLRPGDIRESGSKVVQANPDGTSPKGLNVGDIVVAHNEQRKIAGIKPDGTYTYEKTTGLSKMDEEILPQESQRAIKQYQENWRNAQSAYKEALEYARQAEEYGDTEAAAQARQYAEQAKQAANNAHEAAESVRNVYGYKGGSTGAGYTKTGYEPAFDFDEAPGQVGEASLHPERAFVNRLLKRGAYADDSKTEEYADKQRAILRQATADMLKDKDADKYAGKNAGVLDPNSKNGRLFTDDYAVVGSLVQTPTAADVWNPKVDKRAVEQMNDQERRTYNYLYNKYGAKRADEYLEALNYITLGPAAAEQQAKSNLEFAEKAPALAFGESVLGNAYVAPGAGVQNMSQMAQNWAASNLGIGEYRPIDANNPINRLSQAGGQLRSGARETIDTGNKAADATLKFLYDALGSNLDMGASMLLMGGFGSKAVTAAMSTGSAQQTLTDSLNRGATQEQATMNAFANGMFEYLSETPAVEGLFSLKGGSVPVKDMKSFVANLALQMGVEGGGEAVANITQTAADQAIMGNRSDYAQTIQDNIANGMTPEEARKAAFTQLYVLETARSAGLGAVMGGTMGTMMTGINIRNTGRGRYTGTTTGEDGATIKTYSPIVQDIAESARRADENYGLGSKYVKTIEKIEKGEKTSAVELANLKGALAEQMQLAAKNNKEAIYKYVGLKNVPSEMALKLGRFTGADQTGFAGRAFSHAWAIKTEQIREELDAAMMNPELLTNPDSQVRKDLQEWLGYADILLYSGYLNEEAQSTGAIRAEVNSALYNIPASAAGNNPIANDDETIYEEPIGPEPATEQPAQAEPQTAPAKQSTPEQQAEPQSVGEAVQQAVEQVAPEVAPQVAEQAEAVEESVEEPVEESAAEQVAETAEQQEEQDFIEQTVEEVAEEVATEEVAPESTRTPKEEPVVNEAVETASEPTAPEPEETVSTQSTRAETPTVEEPQKNTAKRGIHKSELESQPQNVRDRIEEAADQLSDDLDDFDVIQYNPDNDTVTLMEVDDFDGKPEPQVIRQVKIDPTGAVTDEEFGGVIIPNKSDYVSDNYTGFDVQAQKDRENTWRDSNKTGIRYDSSRLTDKAYFESKFGDLLSGGTTTTPKAETPKKSTPKKSTPKQTSKPIEPKETQPTIVQLKTLPKGVKLNWKDAKPYSDSEYKYKEVRLVPNGDSLYVRLSRTYKNNPVKQVFYEIPNYRNKTVNQILLGLNEITDGKSAYPLGRHFEDALRNFYKENGLSQGAVEPILRDPVVQEEVIEPILETVQEEGITEVTDELIEEVADMVESVVDTTEATEEEIDAITEMIAEEAVETAEETNGEEESERDQSEREEVREGTSGQSVSDQEADQEDVYRSGESEQLAEESEIGSESAEGQSDNTERTEEQRDQSENEQNNAVEEGDQNELGTDSGELSTSTSAEEVQGNEGERNAEAESIEAGTNGQEDREPTGTGNGGSNGELEGVSENSGKRPGKSRRPNRNGTASGERDSEGTSQRVNNSGRFYIDLTAPDPATLPATQRTQKNIDAIRLYKEITEQGRKATMEEKETLSQYSGWGGLAQVFAGENKLKGKNKQFNKDLKSLLTKDEYKAAIKSTDSAYFTPTDVITDMYNVVQHLGIGKGAKVLEPSCGSGFFIGAMPKGMRTNSAITGIEYDPITGGIAKTVYDDTDIRVEGFEQYQDGTPNLIIGNVPFGSQPPGKDTNYKEESKHLIHDYFITKGLSMLQDGGIMTVLTTNGTMNKEDTNARKQMAEKANLIGAVRLPSGTFGATDVVTDLLIFQKKGEGVDNSLAQDFLETYEDENGLRSNVYFRDHPDMVLGTPEVTTGAGGRSVLYVRPDGRTINDVIQMIPSSIVPKTMQKQSVKLDTKTQETTTEDTFEGPQATKGTIRVKNDVLQMADENGKWVPYEPMDKRKFKRKTFEDRAKAMYDLLQERQKLLEIEATSEDDAEVERAIQDFNDKYDKFVEKFGKIGDKDNKSAYKSDSGNYSKLSSMEDGRAKKKGDIFNRRVVIPKQDVVKVDNITDALNLSLNMTGRVDLEYIAKLYGKQVDDVVEELKGRIYPDPISNEYVTVDELQSGKVRDKYQILANKQDKTDLDFEVMEKLAEVIPADVTAKDIGVQLGAPWVGEEYINQFLKETLGDGVEAYYQEATGTWHLTNNNPWGMLGPVARNKYTVGNVKPLTLFEKVMNNQELKITKDKVLDKEMTNKLQAKADEIKVAFERWLWRDEERQADLEQKYNYLFNNYIPRKFDGSYLTLPGHNPKITLREHQASAVARAIQTRNSLFVHPVGSGKTYAMLASIMEMKRLGISQKPLLVVPNSKVAEFMNDAYKLYPNAKILAIQDDDFSSGQGGAKRKEMLARIEAGSYDMIIMKSSNFDAFPISPEYMDSYIEEELEQYRSLLEAQKGGAANLSASDVKNLEKSMESAENALNKYRETVEENAIGIDVFLDKCGIDSLIVDECQYYKNLHFLTKQKNTKGVPTTGAAKSIHMHMFTKLLNQRQNHIIFASATPVTNSLTELYTMQKYLQPDILKELGISTFDAWAATFGETTQAPELTATGKSAQMVTRFAKFKNLPELISITRQTFDMVDKNDLTYIKLPKVTRHHVTSESGRLLDMLNRAIDQRLVNFKSRKSEGIEAFTMAKYAATDLRFMYNKLIDNGMIPPDTPIEALDLPDSKVNKCVANVLKEYKVTNDIKGTQVIFLDKGIPGGKGEDYAFPLYADIKEKLIRGGIPENEIAFIHDYDSDEKKGDLSEAMNDGEIRVLIGSTEKSGVGLNIQERLKAAHHIDAPMRPSDYEQRNGRIIRQGNINESVDIYNYSTLNSYDAQMWQMLERKQKGIESVMSGKAVGREMEEAGSLEDVFRTMTVEAANNDLLFEQQEIQEQLRKLQSREALFEEEQHRYKDTLYNANEIEERFKGHIADAEDALAKLKNHAGEGITVDGKKYEKPTEASEVAYQKFARRRYYDKLDGVVIGKVDGFDVIAQAFENIETRGAFSIRVDGVPWPTRFTIAYKGQEQRAKSLITGTVGKYDSIFTMVKNRLTEKKGQAYKEEQEQNLANHYEKVADAEQHINDVFAEADELERVRIREKEILDELTSIAPRGGFNVRMMLPEEFSLPTETQEEHTEAEPKNETAPEQNINPETGEIIEEETEEEFPDRLENRRFPTQQENVGQGTNLPRDYLDGGHTTQNATKDYGKATEARSELTKDDIKAAKKMRLQDIVNQIIHDFNVRFTTAGRMTGQTMGYYEAKHRLIHTKLHKALGVGIEELGHHMDSQYRFSNTESLKNMLNNVPGLKKALTEQGYDDAKMKWETAAEFLWQYVTNPDGAYEMGQYAIKGNVKENFYDTFENTLSKDDLEKVKKLRRTIMAYYGVEVAAIDRVAASIRSKAQVEKDRLNDLVGEDKHKRWRALETKFLNYTAPMQYITSQIETMTGKPLSEMDKLEASMDMASRYGTEVEVLIERGGAFLNPDGTINEDYTSFADIFKSLEQGLKDLRKQGKITAEQEDNGKLYFEAYLKSKHSIDWENRGLQTIADDMAKSITGDRQADAIEFHKEAVEGAENIYGDVFRDHAEMLYSWWAEFMQTWAVDTGLIEQETFDKWQEINPHYVPMNRVMEDGELVPISQSKSTFETKRAKGSERETYSPIESMLAMIATIVKYHHKNQLALNIGRLYNSDDQNVRSFMTHYVQKVDARTIASTIRASDVKRKMEQAILNNLSVEERKSFYEMSPKDQDKFIEKKAHFNFDEVFGDKITTFTRSWGNYGKHVLVGKNPETGKTEAFYIKDPNIREALTMLDPRAQGDIARNIGKITRIWSALTTSWNILFAIPNAEADFQHGFVMNGSWDYALRWGKAVGQAMVNEWRLQNGKEVKNKDYLRMKAALGFGSKYFVGRGDVDMESLLTDTVKLNKKIFGPVRKLGALIETSTGGLEMAPRMAAFVRTYEESKKAGLSEEESYRRAAKAAREVTVDFGAKGTQIKTLANIVPFLGASIAGINQARVILSPKELKTKEGRQRIVRALVMHSLPTILMMMFAGFGPFDDDDDNELEKHIREFFGIDERHDEFMDLKGYLKLSYLPVKIGDKWLRVKRDRELAAIFGTTFQIGMMLAFKDDDENLGINEKELMHYILENFVPAHEFVWSGFSQARNNETWYNSYIYNPNLYEDLEYPDAYQDIYDENTSEVAKFLAKLDAIFMPGSVQDWMGGLATPKGIDYFIDQSFGMYGDALLALTRKNVGFKDWLNDIAGKFTFNPEEQNRYQDELYDIIDKLSAEKAKPNSKITPEQEAWLKVLEATTKSGEPSKENKEKIKDLRKQIENYRNDPELTEEDRDRLIPPLMREVGELQSGSGYRGLAYYRNEIKRINNDPDLTDKERKAQLLSVRRQMNRVAENAVTAYRKGGMPNRDSYGDVYRPPEAIKAGMSKEAYVTTKNAIDNAISGITKDKKVPTQMAISRMYIPDSWKNYFTQKYTNTDYDSIRDQMQVYKDVGVGVNTWNRLSKIFDVKEIDDDASKIMYILNSDQYNDQQKLALSRIVNPNMKDENFEKKMAAYTQAQEKGISFKTFGDFMDKVEKKGVGDEARARVTLIMRSDYTPEEKQALSRMCFTKSTSEDYINNTINYMTDYANAGYNEQDFLALKAKAKEIGGGSISKDAAKKAASAMGYSGNNYWIACKALVPQAKHWP